MVVASLVLALGTQSVKAVPFELTNNRIYVPAVVAGKNSWALIDTASARTVLDYDNARDAGIRGIRDFAITGPDGEPARAMRLAERPVRIGGTTLDARATMAVPISQIESFDGKPVPAIIGNDFLSGFIVRLDYGSETVRLFPRGRWMPPRVRPIPLESEYGLLFVWVTLRFGDRKPLMYRALLDTGFGGTAIIPNRIARKDELWDSVKSPVVTTTSGIHGSTRSKLMRVQSLTIGEIQLDRPIVELAEKDQGATGRDARFEMLLGGEILRRFTVTIDYFNNLLYLEPNLQKKEPFRGERLGLVFQRNDKGHIVIHDVWKGSPAEETGFKPGDRVVALGPWTDEMPNLEQLRRFMATVREPLQFTLLRGEETLMLTITPRQITP